MDENIKREYLKNEFCKAIECGLLSDPSGCLVRNDHHCQKTAKQFHHWLNANGFKLVKEEA